MERNVIQYHTEFHLLMAASSLKDINELKFTTIIGPKNDLSDKLISLGATHVEKDCRSDPKKAFPPIIPRKTGITVYTSFLIPFTAINYLNSIGIKPGKIVRTDEGLGSFSSLSHVYSSALLSSNNEFSRIGAAAYAIAHTMLDSLTKITPAFRTDFIFLPDRSINERKQKMAAEILRKTQDRTIDGHSIFISQPMLFKNFKSAAEYISFITETSKKISPQKQLIVKRHRDDNFNYEKHGLRTLDGKSLEQYSLENSTVFGVGSTALITAKVLCNCKEVYFSPLTIGYSGLSKACKEIFERYLTPVN